MHTHIHTYMCEAIFTHGLQNLVRLRTVELWKKLGQTIAPAHKQTIYIHGHLHTYMPRHLRLQHLSLHKTGPFMSFLRVHIRFPYDVINPPRGQVAKLCRMWLTTLGSRRFFSFSSSGWTKSSTTANVWNSEGRTSISVAALGWLGGGSCLQQLHWWILSLLMTSGNTTTLTFTK